MKFIRLFNYIFVALKIVFINLLKYFSKTENYQPAFTNGKRIFFLKKDSTGKRSSDSRWESISKNIDSSRRSFMDIGSQHGYFVLNAEKLGFTSIGVEMSYPSYVFSKTLADLNDSKKAFFINEEINVKNVDTLPSSDIICFLSVFHHIVHFQGYDSAIHILRTLSMNAKDTLFFETGEYEEKEQYWTEAMSFLNNNTRDEMIKIFESFGCFKSIEIISENETHLNGHKRLLFKCQK